MAKVREDRKSIRTVMVKVRYNDMDEQQASESLKEPTDTETDIYSKTSALLRKAWQRRVSLRLVSVKLSNIYDGRFWSGLALDASARQHDAQQRLVDVVDQLRTKFGRGVVLRGHDFTLRNPSNTEYDTPQRREGHREDKQMVPSASFASLRFSSSGSSGSGAHVPCQSFNESPTLYQTAII